MNLDLTETQALLRDTVREYLERELPFARIRAIDEERSWDERLWQVLCAQGWLALPFGEDSGGGGTLVDAGFLVEELARRAAVIPIVEVLAATMVVECFAPPALSGELLAETLAGRRRTVPALLEASDRFDDVEVTADGSGAVTGEKRFVDYGVCATDHLVAARDSAGLGLYLVDATGPGVRSAPRHSIGRTPVADVTYEAAPGVRVGGADAHGALLRLGRALAAVQCLGCMEQALDMTVEYAGVREQFGRPIGTFQAVQHHCADMASRLASTRFLVFEALDRVGNGNASDAAVALAKASVSRAVPDVTMLAHQIHGGNGVVEENDLYFFTLRGKERSLAWGSAEECLAVVASCVDAPEEWL